MTVMIVFFLMMMRIGLAVQESEVAAERTPCDRETGLARNRRDDARSALNGPITSTQIFLLGAT